VVPLVGFGPVDPVHGFPGYYQDSTLLALEPCLDFACDPALGLPNPAASLSFPDNFPGEFFYLRAIANMSGPNGETFQLNLALEGSFVNGTPVAGQQLVFTRVRVRATGVVAGAVYTVTHPFGVETITADSLPPRLIDFRRDTGRVPLAFGLALHGDVGPFLRFASGTAPPPPGTIGNPAATQTVTGSACGQNFFKVEGPGLPAGGVQTDQFNTLIGRVAALCGNGVVDVGEQCDMGAANGARGSCCTVACAVAPAGTACDDGNVCTTNGACDGVSPVCPFVGFNTAPCDDGHPCTPHDTCNGAGVCVGGLPVDCNDGNVCTTDACDGAGGCIHTFNTLPCNDGNVCTVVDTCNGAGVCVGGPANCDDGNVCTTDSCNPATGCTHVNNTLPCDDQNACTTHDTCNGAGACVGGPPPICDDGNVCTADSCNPATGCTHTNVPAPCDDGNACTSPDACSAGRCVGGPPVSCNDGNVCTDDLCDPATGCKHVNNVASCNDGNACTTGDTCSGGRCVGGPPPNCDDGNPCTTDSCDTTVGCVHVPNTLPCNDGNACTVNDTCAAGTCKGTPRNCDDGNVCTADSCNPATGCQHANVSGPCDDGNACTVGDACSAGVCVPGGPRSCDDGNPCTTDSCNPASGCVHVNNTAPCDDGNACTTKDTCNGAGTCVGGPPPNCDDGNVCTADSCNPATGCTHTSAAGPCDDGNPCTSLDTCSGGRCVGGPPTDCSDGNVCTDDLCDPATGCQHVNNTASCDDGNACTTGDTCSGGRCIGGPPPNCDDGNVCTDDTCSPGTGCVHVNNTAPCDDGNACTVDDACSAGACVPGAPRHCDDGNPCTDDGCDPGTGCTTTPVERPCDDGNRCTTEDRCIDGVCTGGSPLDCDDGNPCTDERCNATTGCVHVPNDAVCDDGNPTTLGDRCADTVCVPGPPGCPAQPATGCVEPGTPAKTHLGLHNLDGGSHDSLLWSWTAAAGTSKQDFGDPVAGTTGYQLCIYDGVGGVDQLVFGRRIPPRGTCNGRPCWRETASGFIYRDRYASNAGGIQSLMLLGGSTGQASLRAVGRGAGLALSSPPIHPDGPVTVELLNGPTCWKADYPTGTFKGTVASSGP